MTDNKLTKYKCALNWHYNQDIDADSLNLIPSTECEQTPEEVAAFMEWQKKSRKYSDGAEKKINALFEKLGADVPMLDFSEAINKRNDEISAMYTEYEERKGFLDGDITDMEKLTAKMTMTNIAAGKSLRTAIDSASTYLELTQLKEVALEQSASSDVIQEIDSKIENCIYPNFTAEVEAISKAIPVLMERQNEANRELMGALINARLTLEVTADA